MTGHAAREQAGQRDQQQVPDRGQVRREQPAQGRPGQAAEAPRGVKARHERPSQRGHQVHGDAVHGYVEAAVSGPEDQQREAERGRRTGQRGQHQGHRQQRAGAHRDALAAEPAAQRPGDQHRSHRPGRQAQQREPQGGGRGPGLLLDRGHPDRPAGEDEPVHREHRAQGGPGPG